MFGCQAILVYKEDSCVFIRAETTSLTAERGLEDKKGHDRVRNPNALCGCEVTRGEENAREASTE